MIIYERGDRAQRIDVRVARRPHVVITPWAAFTGVDAALVQAKLAQRVAFKRNRHFDGADAIQAELLSMA